VASLDCIGGAPVSTSEKMRIGLPLTDGMAPAYLFAQGIE